MSMPSTKVLLGGRRVHALRQTRRQRRAADTQQAHHIAPADPADLRARLPPRCSSSCSRIIAASLHGDNLAPRDPSSMRQGKGEARRVAALHRLASGDRRVMVLASTLMIFLIANTVPGDPVLTQLGDIAANNPVIVAAYRHKWGLDLPMWDRYWMFLADWRTATLASPFPRNGRCWRISSNTRPQRSNFPPSPSCCRCWSACRSAWSRR